MAWLETKILREAAGLFGSTEFPHSLGCRRSSKAALCKPSLGDTDRTAGSPQGCLLPAPTGLGLASVYLACR